MQKRTEPITGGTRDPRTCTASNDEAEFEEKGMRVIERLYVVGSTEFQRVAAVPHGDDWKLGNFLDSFQITRWLRR